MAKHICLLHGYLLSGSGSNVYTCNLAKEWRSQGQAVTIICQDLKAGSYNWVDEFYGPHDEIPATPPVAGTCRVIVPDIGGLLMVYNYDEYDGFTTKTIPNCTDAEIERHITMTARAVNAVANQGGCHRVLANHVLLSPVIAKRGLKGTSVPYDVKLHGSGLTVVVKPFPHFKKYAIEGLQNCNKIIAGTRHIANQIKELFLDESDLLKLNDKLVTIPPGMDPTIFRISEDDFSVIRAFFLKEVRATISCERGLPGRQSSNFDLPSVARDVFQPDVNVHDYLVDLSNTYNQRVVEYDLPQRFPVVANDEPVVIFFGKFINTKGLGELLLCFPTIVGRIPKIRLILVGYGIVREHMEMMVYALKTGNQVLFQKVSQCLDENGKPFFESTVEVQKLFCKLTDEQASRITITGYLNHSQLGLLLPLASVSIVASKVSEAFGMVSVEAMAAGVLPLCLYHSGLRDVLDEVKHRDPELEQIMHIDAVPGGDFGASNGVEFMKVCKSRN